MLRAFLLSVFLLNSWSVGGEVRRPVALVLDHANHHLLIANQRSGTISLLSTQNLEVSDEFRIGDSLADLISTPLGLVSIEPSASEILVFDHVSKQILHRLAVAHDPRRVIYSAGTDQLIVSSGWSRSVSILRRNQGQFERKRIQLAFPPQEMVLISANEVLVADAFAGELAVIDLKQGMVSATHTLPVHNMRGLALSVDQHTLYVTHQLLSSAGTTHFDHLTWGELITNGILSIPVSALQDDTCDLFEHSERELLGNASDSGGDPGQIIVQPNGEMFIAMTGSGNVGVADSLFTFQNVEVESGPVAMVRELNGPRLFVANHFSDSISVINVEDRLVVATIPLSDATELSSIDRGEQLFFDARLSNDRWMSCNSCHSQGHTIEANVDTLGDGDFGAPKRIPSLLGIGNSAPYAWDGSLASLEDQIRKSVNTTLHGVPLTERQVQDLEAYLKSLSPPPPIHALDQSQLVAGKSLFVSSKCTACHNVSSFTSTGTYDVGLQDEQGRSRFNPPSLLGVGQRRKFFHDGRASSLHDALKLHQQQLSEELTNAEIDELVLYLNSLQ